MVRENTWHKTIVTNNQVPTGTALFLHSKRIAFVLKLNGEATEHELSNKDHTIHGWKIATSDAKDVLLPEWDTEASKSSLDLIRKAVLKKCGCAKTRCARGKCGCRQSSELCTKICTCKNCTNRGDKNQDTDTDGKVDSEGDESESEDEEEGEVEEENGDDDGNSVDSDNEVAGPSVLDSLVQLMQEEDPLMAENADSIELSDLVS